ncbi:hypothetical protein P9480_09945 [Bacillus atrophaeus]|uniref:hypothetical protein n=1 Tax=Bacillus atrophaeus TaxID=1452 RepID=UPI002E1CC661|nr:hypothetical protein [Bacillus atrophaeus]
MGLLILMTLVAVTVSILVICGDPFREFIDYVMGIFFGLIAAVVVLLIALIPSFCIETKPVNPHKTEIYSIKDNAETSGSFVLGSGTVDEKQYLYFVKEKDGFKTVSKAAVEDSKMKEGKYAKPYVLTYDVQFKSSFARFFYGKSTGYEEYEFYLPEDTITTEYKIDLE